MEVVIRDGLGKGVKSVENKEVVYIHHEAHIWRHYEDLNRREKQEPDFELDNCIIRLIVTNRNLYHFECEEHALAAHEQIT